MSVVRIEKNKNYTTMSNYHLRDKNLSLKAKGLLSVVLSLPDNWDYSIEGLVSILKEEKRAVKNALDELVQNKYLIILKLKAVKGKRKNIEYVYTFYERPFNQENLNKLLNNIDKKELIKFDYGINLDNLDNVDIHNVYLQEDTQINKEELSKDNKYDNTDNISNPIVQKLLDLNFLNESDNLEIYNKLFDKLSEQENFNKLEGEVMYIAKQLIKNKFKDENGEVVTNKYGYLKNALEFNFDKFKSKDVQVDNEYDWLNDNNYP